MPYALGLLKEDKSLLKHGSVPAGRDVEPAFQNIAGQMAAIKAMRARTRLLPPGALPARERAVQRIDEGFWRQARSLKLQCRAA